MPGRRRLPARRRAGRRHALARRANGSRTRSCDSSQSAAPSAEPSSMTGDSPSCSPARYDAQIFAVTTGVGEELDDIGNLRQRLRVAVEHLAAVPDVILDVETLGDDQFWC